MKQEETYVGIDVAKDRLDVGIRPEGDIWSVDYDEQAVSAVGIQPVGSGTAAREPPARAK